MQFIVIYLLFIITIVDLCDKILEVFISQMKN